MRFSAQIQLHIHARFSFNAQQALEVARALEWELDLGQVEQLSEQAKLLHARRSELPWLKNL